jgi:methylglutaconyl-CoA hydratase
MRSYAVREAPVDIAPEFSYRPVNPLTLLCSRHRVDREPRILGMVQRPHVSLAIEGHVARVVLERPPVNALNQTLVASLTSIAREVRRDRSVWLVAVTSGCSAFCAGADLKERAGLTESRVGGVVGKIRQMIRAWHDLPQPVLVGIDGPALGGGLEFALAADLVIASERATFGFPEVRLGIIPGAGGTQLLARRTGPAAAGKWVLTSRRFTAAEAHADGVVDFLLPGEGFAGGFAGIVAEVGANAPLALRQAKRAIRASTAAGLSHGLAIERSCYAPLIRTQDRKEALQAFLERREPRWTGR